MISRLGLAVCAVFRRVAPDPFVIAVLLSVVTFVLALTVTDTSAVAALDIWASGLWELLGFSMQMCLILVTGHALASSPPVSRGLHALARLPRTGAQGVALVALVAALLGVLNWGLGLIGGALIARRVGVALEARGVRAHYPLIAAAGYVGMMVWHGGLSGSAPLKVTTGAQIADIFKGEAPFGPIPLTETIFSPMNIVITGGLLVLSPVLMGLMTPKRSEDIEVASSFGLKDEERERPADPDKAFIPRLLEDTPLVTVVLLALIGWWAWRYYLPAQGLSGITALTPDTVNLTMLMVGMALHGTPLRYVQAIEEAARGCAGIILQFPIYAGIMAVMRDSGLTHMMAKAMASTSDPETLPLLTFLSASVVNLFVPSGGGQWAVQGPIAMQSAAEVGASPAKMVMAVAYGDQLTNMVQPFWALPLLAITGVKARAIVGYTAMVMVVAGIWIGLWVLVF